MCRLTVPSQYKKEIYKLYSLYTLFMKRLNDLEYLKLSKPRALWYNICLFVCSIPGWFKKLFISIWNFICGIGDFIATQAKDIAYTFTKGNLAVKLSFLIFGLGNLYYGQILRGVLFLVFEIVFFVYMFIPTDGGIYWLDKAQFFQTGNTVGTVQQGKGYQTIYLPDGTPMQVEVKIDGDDSVRVLLYALLTVFFIIAFIYTWRLQVKQCRINMDIRAKHGKIKRTKDDLKSLLDDQFHKTLLALPTVGIALFTVLPIIYMMIISFTNYGDYKNQYYDGAAKLFQWVGFEHWNTFFDGNSDISRAFGDILIWTLTWAFFATFTNYFLGMLVAMLINKKGIKFKKFWRTVLVLTIAIPQFVSLLYVKNMFIRGGFVNNFLLQHNLIPQSMLDMQQLSLWENPISAKILVIVLNIWIGIPHIMLMATGILMNIPADLYESSRVDGANSFQQFMRITLPYMLFVTGPYLLTSFVGNLNNFNVIYFLSGGGPSYTTADGFTSAGGVTIGHTDLLITWLYKMTIDSAKLEYYNASLIGIMVFVVVAVLSLIVYNVLPSNRNEEDYA